MESHPVGTEAPVPLVPADVDLRDFPFMGLDVRRLRDSRIVATVEAEEFRAAILLWCASWHQVPAGSLPDDDIELAQLAGYGRVVKEWRKVRTGAMYGMVRCSDGRWYHPIVAEKAVEAWESKLRRQHEKMCERVRKANKLRVENGDLPVRVPSFDDWNSAGRRDPFPPEPRRVPAETASSSGNDPPEPAINGDGVPPENVLIGNREGEGERKERTNSDSSAPAGAPPPLPAPSPPPSVVYIAKDGAPRCVQIAVHLRNLERARGKALRIASTDKAVLDFAEDERVTDAVLAEAHAMAVTDRDVKGDSTPIPAGFLTPFVRRILTPSSARGSVGAEPGYNFDRMTATLEERKRQREELARAAD